MRDELRAVRREAQNLRARLRLAEAERDEAIQRRRADLEARLAHLPPELRARAPRGDLDRLAAFVAGAEAAERSPVAAAVVTSGRAISHPLS